MEISSVFTVSNRGTVLAGRVLQGTVGVGDRAILKSALGDMPTCIAGVEVNRKIIGVARAGDEAGVLCRDLEGIVLDGNLVGDEDNHKLQGVFLVSAPPRWWEFWVD